MVLRFINNSVHVLVHLACYSLITKERAKIWVGHPPLDQ